MQSTQVLLSNAQLRLRLQAPVVTAGPYSAVAQAAEDAHGFTWQATAGQVTLSGAIPTAAM